MLCQVLSLNGGKYKNIIKMRIKFKRKSQIKRLGDEYIRKNVSGVCGFVKQRQPGGTNCQTTVQVGGVLLLMNVQGFQ